MKQCKLPKKGLLLMFVCSVLFLSFSSCQNKAKKADELRLKYEFEEAAKLYKEAADEGDAYAMWKLSRAYTFGEGVEVDDKKGFRLLEEAANAGLEEAKAGLARWYIEEFSTKTDIDKGKKMMDSLVETSTNAFVLSSYAEMLMSGNSAYEKNEKKAIKILESIDDKDDPFYLYDMGLLFSLGVDNDVDYQKALEYFSKAFEKGRFNTAYLCGTIYYYGDHNVKKNMDKSVEWLKKGVQAMDADCMSLLGQIYCGTDKKYYDVDNGIKLLGNAAKLGNTDAMTILSICYENGGIVDKDDEKSFKYAKQAFDKGDAEAGFLLGLKYCDGVGCKKNEQKAVEIWEMAADLGSGGAANNIYVYYNEKNNFVKAKKYLFLSAKLGNVMGMYNLARHYYLGDNLVEKNLTQAFIYAKRAADLGNPGACALTSYMLENGEGCDVNPKEAKKYKKKATGEE
ncbi:tetratricopeptide repeat protein [Prevotella nigrescens]|uniref:tetratricopeptide repeat protein n=1 Tax=Prevotella nigrescens TaxID=28133 RepID=UPI001C5DD4BB|nr:tetratricopeptide repeat protein [Prevotella nigrescens]MBW4727092.1 SEL1-like repeat protein [Prevotella nigrescens]